MAFWKSHFDVSCRPVKIDLSHRLYGPRYSGAHFSEPLIESVHVAACTPSIQAKCSIRGLVCQMRSHSAELAKAHEAASDFPADRDPISAVSEPKFWMFILA